MSKWSLEAYEEFHRPGGTRIEDWKEHHAGGRLLILGNGPSWKQHDLSRITCPIIGLNQAWRMRDCTYYAAGDREQFEMYRKEHGTLETWAPLFATERREDDAIPGADHAIKLKPHHINGRKRFSFDLTEGVYLNHTIASYALQLAVWMLGDSGTIYLIGIDCTGPSLNGGEIPQYKHENQRETLAYIRGVLDVARPNINIYTLSMVMTSFAFDRMHFNEAFPLPESTWLATQNPE
jgi:hypothetical protein